MPSTTDRRSWDAAARLAYLQDEGDDVRRCALVLDAAEAGLLKLVFVADVTRFIAEQAQELVWTHGVKPKDAIHVATALSAGVPFLDTTNFARRSSRCWAISPSWGLQRLAVRAVGEAPLADLKTRPDYAVTVRNALVGFIEVKAPGKALLERIRADRLFTAEVLRASGALDASGAVQHRPRAGDDATEQVSLLLD